MSNAALLAVVVAGGRVGVGVHPAPSASAPAARRGGRHRRRRLQLVMLQVVVAGVAGVASVVGKRLLMRGRLGARGRAQLLRSVEPERGLCNGGGGDGQVSFALRMTIQKGVPGRMNPRST